MGKLTPKTKKQKFWFSVGDLVYTFPLSDPPEIGDVIEEGEEAIVQFPDQKYGPKTLKCNLMEQHKIWNGNGYREGYNPHRLIRQSDIKRNMKNPKKFKVGDIVEIVSNAPWGSGTNKHDKRPKVGEVGLIVKMTPCEYFANVYLQNDMRYVWREIHEIKKL